MPIQSSRRTPFDLERRLISQVSKEWRAIRGTSVSGWRERAPSIVGNPASRSRTTCSRRTPADLHEMIFRDPTRSTHGMKDAYAAMLDRIGLGCRVESIASSNRASHTAVIGGEIVLAQGALLADAEKHVHMLRASALNVAMPSL